MNYKITTSTIIFLAISIYLFGQTDFRAAIEAADPVDRNINSSLDFKIETHQDFLSKSFSANDTLQELYANLLLAYDFINALRYTEAADVLLRADELASAAGNKGWLGWVRYRRGILSLRLKEYEKALEYYRDGANKCELAGDSLCLAECLEQMSIMSAMIDDYDGANKYHEMAMPLLQKYGSSRQIASAYNNFGTVNSLQEDPGTAIPFYKKAIALHIELGQHKNLSKALNNLADSYRRQDRFELSMATYQRCLDLNQKYGFHENLISNYRGLYTLKRAEGSYEQALEYLETYYEIRDSIIDEKTKARVAELEVKYESQTKEIALEKNRSALLQVRQSFERSVALLVLLMILGVAGAYGWYQQNRRARLDKIRNRQNLADLTRLLLVKNEQIVDMNQKLLMRNPALQMVKSNAVLDKNIYEMRILTDEDWFAFKTYFERAYPGYAQNLRASYEDLSPGEERLFLLIRLGLNSKEVASILGISHEGVKKSRNRLRKRLNLMEDVILEKFVQSF